MEMTKEDAHREKLEKWRMERQKEKELKTKRPVGITTGKKPALVKSAAPANTKSAFPVPVKSATTGRTSLLSQTRKSKVHPEVKQSRKPVTKRTSEDTNALLERLAKWKEEKGRSVKKEQPSSHKLLATSTSAKPEENSKKLKPVKSRLFDYQTKQKPTGPNKENKLSHMKDTKLDSKRPSNHHVIKPKPDLKRKSRDVHTSVPAKRRYSEALSKHEKSKPFSGILKRKSCVGSFNFTGGDAAKAIITQGNDEGDSQGVESRRLSYTVTPGKDDTARKTFPVAAVTPGVSSRNVRFRTPPNNGLGQEKMKMKKTPKPANESERREALNAWLKSKNKTPSKFRHLMCFHAKQEDRSLDPLTKTSLSVKELSSQLDVMEREQMMAAMTEQMNAMLDECMLLFEAGCPSESILSWLKSIEETIPFACSSARFYTCKAAVVKDSLDLDMVLQVFEEATINNAQPKEDIAKCLRETLKYVTERKIQEASRRGRTPRRSEVQAENVFKSSKVVYTVSDVTPFSEGKKRRRSASQTPCQVVTPVRRSTRRSLQNMPDSLKDRKASYTSIEEVGSKDDILFQPNVALDTILAGVEDDD
ncbi:uncharacterized protein LOC128213314 [Mya arenaria]|uniref:uncharacterized protein LOC128213314 n=1 Tax=Mya arenaria TaxID=6604 RepID=UPI0022E04D93|nr:uncharacterized protein LOC128213314 [Mya arenaria]